jgi:hypothetical protein
MGTPRLSEPVDQMRNVQRTASCGDAIAHDRVREKESRRSNEKQSGEPTVTVATQVAFNSNPETPFASGCEAGAVFFCEVAQQVLFAQQPGLHAFCAGESVTMQVRAEICDGTAINAMVATSEIAILPIIRKTTSTLGDLRRPRELFRKSKCVLIFPR